MTLHDEIERDLNLIATTDQSDSLFLPAILDDTTPCAVGVTYGTSAQIFEGFAADVATVVARVSEVGIIEPRQKFTIAGKAWFVHQVLSSDGHISILLCIANKRIAPQNMA